MSIFKVYHLLLVILPLLVACLQRVPIEPPSANPEATTGNNTNPAQDPGEEPVPTNLLPLFVDQASTAGSPDGQSWATAFRNIMDAVNVVKRGQKILVAAGLYYNPAIDLADKQHIMILGGYDSALLDAQGLPMKSTKETILECAVKQKLMTISGKAKNITIDGLTFQNVSQSSTVDISNQTGPTIENITIANCKFSYNNHNASTALNAYKVTSAALIIADAKNVRLENVDAYKNLSASYGGFLVAVKINGLTISGGRWSDNQATLGGALALLNCQDVKILGTTFYGNKATALTESLNKILPRAGGAIFLMAGADGKVLIGSDTKFYQNVSDNSGGAIYAVLDGAPAQPQLIFENHLSDFSKNSSKQGKGNFLSVKFQAGLTADKTKFIDVLSSDISLEDASLVLIE